MDARKNLFYGEKVKQILNDNGLTMVEIAKKSGVERALMSSYIHGKRNPKRITVQRIADALHVNISEISGYRDDDIVEADSVEIPSTENDFFDSVYRFVHREISRQVNNENQSVVAKRIGLSSPQVNRLVAGKADLSLFPIGALLKLCPQIINRDVVFSDTYSSDLSAVIANIKSMAEKITDINTARTVENMLKGLIGN